MCKNCLIVAVDINHSNSNFANSEMIMDMVISGRYQYGRKFFCST